MFDRVPVVVPGSGQVIFIAKLVNLGCSNKVAIHPGSGEVDYRIRAGPHFQVFTFIKAATCSG